MFHLRRSALRLLTSQPSSFLSKPRSFATVSSPALRQFSRPTTLTFQQRWASSEAEAKQQDEEEQSINAEEPSLTADEAAPEEQVEELMHADNAAEYSASETVGDEAAHESGDEPSSRFNDAVEAVKETVSNVAEGASNIARNVTGMGRNASDSNDRPRVSDASFTEPKSTIYIGNLFFDVTENDLMKELSRFGNIIKCRLIRDSRGLSKGFGYVDFETIASATKAIETLNQQLFEGRRLAVQYAAYTSRTMDAKTAQTGDPTGRPRKPLNPPSKTLFIGNMSFEMTDRDLNALFRGVKNVIDVRVAIDRRTGQPRGFAHADFIDTQSAIEAFKILEAKETYGRKLRLDYSYGPSNSPTNLPGADRERGRQTEQVGEQQDN